MFVVLLLVVFPNIIGVVVLVDPVVFLEFYTLSVLELPLMRLSETF